MSRYVPLISLIVLLNMYSASCIGAGEYASANLPALLEFADGRPVRTMADWQQRQSEIRQLMIETFTGTFPSETPRLLDAEIVREERRADGSTQRRVKLTFDTRITSVVARSPGLPASCPYRFTSRDTFAEAPPDFPGDWFLPSLKQYYGREHELPMDAHGWYALVAPRRCLVHTAHNDGCEPTFAVERAYREGHKVYDLLGRPENLRAQFRVGAHNPTTDAHRKRYFDWFDLSFGRGEIVQNQFPEEFIHRFDWQAWQARQAEGNVTPPSKSADVRTRMEWALGTVPKHIPASGRPRFLTDDESEMMTHDRWKVENTARIPVNFGADVRGNIYHNPTVTDPAPAVIWLHPYSYHSGYNEGYGVQGTTVYHRLAQQGFVVLAYDQCGFGLRLLEGRDFYRDYPHWSRLGRMVYDVRSAVDFLAERRGDAKSEMPPIDRQQIYVLGYSVGGTVGLYAAALDDRITGVASFCGFTPLRTDTDAKTTGGTRRLWQWHALQPKLGLFHGQEQQIPYDFDDVIGQIAPRPCLIVSPQRDRDADFNEVVACIDRARQAWVTAGSADGLRHLRPDDISRFQADQHAMFTTWWRELQKQTSKD